MSRSEVFKCDVCGKQKGEANHWFLAGIRLSFKPPVIVVGPWGEDLIREEGIIHLCGEECVQKKVSEFLSAGAE